jgi:putative transposase
MTAIEQSGIDLGTAAMCRSLDVSRASLYRSRKPEVAKEPKAPRTKPHPRALDSEERQLILDTLNSERFWDHSPAEVHATLLEEQTYIGSTRTMYRVLAGADQVRERRDQLRHPSYAKPELLATAPNQVWSWDITKLKGPIKWTYFYLFVILDIFSRYVVGWMVARNETAHLAQRLIDQTCDKQNIQPGQLTIHADRGSAMRSKSVALLYSDLGIEASHSRPHVSDDNPFSEAHFRTMKYRPEFPDRFGSLQHARDICRQLFPWYNEKHHHGGLEFLTPDVVHHGRAEQVLDARHRSVLTAYAAHPERFVNGPPKRGTLPTAVWINPPEETTLQDAPGSTIVSPDDPEVVAPRRNSESFPQAGNGRLQLVSGPERPH